MYQLSLRFPVIYMNYSTEEIIAAYIKYISNRKKCDKYSLSYQIGMIDPNHVVSFVDHFTREELLNKLISRIDNKSIFRLINSDYTVKQVAEYLFN